VQELAAKKKYHAVEDEGRKLPASWKSVARLEEEEKKELDRLKKMKEDIEQLESELVQEEGSGSEMEEGEGQEKDEDREVFVLPF
jgi:Skp family chaperone for outer membrane proteins